jgi:hypothetical protein
MNNSNPYQLIIQLLMQVCLEDLVQWHGYAFLSGAGADSKETSRKSITKYKGMAENYFINQNWKTEKFLRY